MTLRQQYLFLARSPSRTSVCYPEPLLQRHLQLLDAPEAEKLFPADVRARAKEYLDGLGGGGTGAYTHSQGVDICRQHVAKVPFS